MPANNPTRPVFKSFSRHAWLKNVRDKLESELKISEFKFSQEIAELKDSNREISKEFEIVKEKLKLKEKDKNQTDELVRISRRLKTEELERLKEKTEFSRRIKELKAKLGESPTEEPIL